MKGPFTKWVESLSSRRNMIPFDLFFLVKSRKKLFTVNKLAGFKDCRRLALGYRVIFQRIRSLVNRGYRKKMFFS